MLFYICVTITAQGHMTLDSPQDDTNSEDSSMNTMLFKFLLETLVSDSSDLNNKLDRLEDKYYEQNYKIVDLETTLGEQNDEILELKGTLISSEKLVIEQNRKISELETKTDKIEELETTFGELKGNLVASEKLVIDQNKKISELEAKQNDERKKNVALEINIADKDNEILELKGNLETNTQLIKDQTTRLEESNLSWQEKFEEHSGEISYLKGRLKAIKYLM